MNPFFVLSRAAVCVALFTATEASAQNTVGILGAGACQWSTIGSAITAAANGATILIREGNVYNEHLGTITKDLTIRSGNFGCTAVSSVNAAPPTIDGTNTGRVAAISGEVTFIQLIIRDGETTEDPGANLLVTSTGELVLDDVTVTGGVLHETIGAPTTWDPFGAGIHVDAFGELTLRGDTLVSGNLNNRVGPGGIMVEAGAIAVLEDNATLGVPPFWANVATQCCGGGAGVLGRLEMHDDSAIVFNTGGLGGGGIYVWEHGEVELNDNASINGNFASKGGGILIGDDAFVVSISGSGRMSISENNTDGGSGAGVYMEGGTLELADVDLHQNKADSSGGAIYAADLDQYPLIELDDVDIDSNTAGDCGGGIAMFGGELNFDLSSITHNSADIEGGGLCLSGTNVDGNGARTNIDSNDADLGGGLALLAGAELFLAECPFSWNHADSDGGAVYISGAASDLAQYGLGAVSGNSANRGGGVYIQDGELNLSSIDFIENTAVTEGGAVRVAVGAVVDIDAGLFEANVSGTMGGALAIAAGVLSISGSNVFANIAGTHGGGATVANTGFMTAESVWFRDNEAEQYGGGIAVLAHAANTNPRVLMTGSMSLEGCETRGPIGTNKYCSELRGNSSASGGGAIYAEDGTVEVYRTAIINNTTTQQGSAVLLKNAPLGSPAMIVNNLLIVKNGTNVSKDVVRVAGGTLTAQHITSAENTGIPLRLTPAAGASSWRRSIIWDALSVEIDVAQSLAADCSMFRAVNGTTTGLNRDFGLDPVFVTTPRGDYRLDAVASVDAVDQCAIGLGLDLDSDPRPQINDWDRGAFEAAP